MADTFKKIEVEGVKNLEGNDWKDVSVEKEHQPEKVKSIVNYRSMEAELKSINNNITSLTKEKVDMEAGMVKVKAVAE